MRSSFFSPLLIAGALLPTVVLAERFGWFGCPTPTPDDSINKADPLTQLTSMMPLRVYLMDGPPEEVGQYSNITLDFANWEWVVNYFNRTTQATPISTPSGLPTDGPSPAAVFLKALPRFLLGAAENGDLALTPIQAIGDNVVIFKSCWDRGAFLSHRNYMYLAIAPSLDTTTLDWRCMAEGFNALYGIDSFPGGV